MTKHTLEVLQYKQICEIISNKCITEEAQIKCLSTEPSTDSTFIKKRKQLGNDFLQLLHQNLAPQLIRRPPVTEFLKTLHIKGASLEIEGIYSFGLLAKSVQSLQLWADAFLDENPNTENSIVHFINSMPSLEIVRKAVFSFIDENGELQNIPVLTKIKKQIASIENQIERTMNDFFSNESYRGMLQSEVPTIKDGRQVIALKANYKGRIKGIIHGYSQSGQTFFIEPEKIVQKNNELFEANAEYSRELKKLLTELTAKIAEEKTQIEKAVYKITELDTIMAGAKWAKQENCVFALDTTETSPFFLHQARHPLIGGKAVPIDLKLKPKTKVVIITGPNTGGKTVSLKTACLFALINQSGWPVPAGEKTRLPIFDFIGCDIGDEQSIDQSLSTFSAHMQNIAEILKKAGNNSLIALDELGSGTDPQEGGAIAMAILDSLIEKQSLVFVTTHHGVLKNYGYSNELCENASVEFNQDTLAPTYKILMGVPGESHALDIAKRNGLPENIIKKANSLLVNNRADVSNLIKGLIQKHEALNEFEAVKKEEEQSLREAKRKADLKALKLKQKELELRDLGYKRLENFFNTKRKEMENLIREIREGEITKEKTKSVKEWFNEFEKELTTEKTELQKEKMQTKQLKEKQPVNIKLNEGVKVFIPSYNRHGEIIRKDKNGKWIVALENLQIAFTENELQLDENQGIQKTPITATFTTTTKRPKFELKLLGMRCEEAQEALQEQLDLAIIHQFTTFSIIHGKGDGILQTMVHDTLKSFPHVKEFYFAKPEDGGSGKTYVILK